MYIADLESASLLALCLKKIAGLDKPGVKVLDAVWVWTEPHSKRYVYMCLLYVNIIELFCIYDHQR